MKQIKRYFRAHSQIKSAVDTFVTVFLITFLPLLSTMSWDKATLYGALAVALRAGFKSLSAFLIEDKTDDFKRSK